MTTPKAAIPKVKRVSKEPEGNLIPKKYRDATEVIY
jgi:hypothetical protein